MDKPHFHVTGGVFFRDGKVLLMRRGPGHRCAGSWEYPGGKIEPGETGKDCIRRELREELAVDAEIGPCLGSTVHDMGDRIIYISAYLVLSYEGAIRLIDHDAMEWVPLSDLVTHPQLPSDVELSRQIVAALAAYGSVIAPA